MGAVACMVAALLTLQRPWSRLAHRMASSASILAPLQLSGLQGVEAAKRAAAYAAVDNHVKASDTIIGVGSGAWGRGSRMELPPSNC